MKKIALFISLILFVLLAACSQNPEPSQDLSLQGLEFGSLKFTVVSDYRDGAEESNFNGAFDKGEFLVPGILVKFTPINEKGEVIGESIDYITTQATDPSQATMLKLPVGIYQPEVILPTDLQGGSDYSWRPFGPGVPTLPPVIIDTKHMFDGIYGMACDGGRQFVAINGFNEYQLSPCFSKPTETTPPFAKDAISVSPNVIDVPCGPQNVQAVVAVSYRASNLLPVTLSVDPSSLPAGMTASFSPSQTDTTSTLTLSINGAADGSYPIMIKDDRGQTTTLTVNYKADPVVNIPDAELASLIKQTLNIPAANVVCEEDMLLLTSLNSNFLPKSSISNLEGLQYAKNLEFLIMSWQQIQDFTPLSGLTQLNYLNLQWVSTIGGNPTFLSNLKNLTSLDLSSTGISNLTPLSNLTKLTYLVLDHTHISDLTPLSNLSNLTALYLSHNQISDIAPLSNLTNLTRLALAFTNISDLTPLVYNSALGSSKDAIIWVSYNPLGLSDPNDPDHDNIRILQNRGATVHY